MRSKLILIAVALLLLAALLTGRQQPPISRPVEQTAMVAMRDGVRLATYVYLPPGGGPAPVILARTPYSKLAFAGAAEYFSKLGYAVVVQDVRGRFNSEGENLPFEADGWWGHRDGYDTLEWIATQPWCNGKIGLSGGSAAGIAEILAAASGSRRIACEWIAIAPLELYRAIYPGGIFKKAMIERWLAENQFDADARRIWTAHPTYDRYWQRRDPSRRLDRIDCPAIHLGGWFDIFQPGTIDAFVGFQSKAGPRARGAQKLVLGPWAHQISFARTGELNFPGSGSPPGDLLNVLRWYDHYLKGLDNGIEKAPAVTYYVMGDVSDPAAPGNTWRTADSWPPFPTRATPFYLQADHSLSQRPEAGNRSLSYDYDPNHPVPTIGGPQLNLPSGPRDQRAIEGRADLLVFTSEELSQPMEITGRVSVELWASTDQPDTDFFARLCDVYPDGRSFNICEGGVRARLRESTTKAVAVEPNRPYRFNLDLWSTSLIINRGHRLRLHITSSSFPGYAANPNSGVGYPRFVAPRPAHNTIYTGPSHPSRLLLPLATSSSAE